MAGILLGNACPNNACCGCCDIYPLLETSSWCFSIDVFSVYICEHSTVALFHRCCRPGENQCSNNLNVSKRFCVPACNMDVRSSEAVVTQVLGATDQSANLPDLVPKIEIKIQVGIRPDRRARGMLHIAWMNPAGQICGMFPRMVVLCTKRGTATSCFFRRNARKVEVSFSGDFYQKLIFLKARGYLGRPWGAFRHRGSIFDDFLEAFWRHLEPIGRPFASLGIFRPLGHHFAASGGHWRHHAVRTLFLPFPGEEKVRFLGCRDVAYI